MSSTYTVRIRSADLVAAEVAGGVSHPDVIVDGDEVHVRGLTRDDALALASVVVARGGDASVWGEQASAVTMGPGARLTIGAAPLDRDALRGGRRLAVPTFARSTIKPGVARPSDRDLLDAPPTYTVGDEEDGE